MDSNTRSAIIGNLACFIAYLIFGFNIVFCKNIADCGVVSPMTLYLMRALGALALFWLISIFSRRTKKQEHPASEIFQPDTMVERSDAPATSTAQIHPASETFHPDTMVERSDAPATSTAQIHPASETFQPDTMVERPDASAAPRKIGGIEVRDMWKVAVASLLGLFLTQLSFLKAVTLTTALDISILSLLSPIMALLVAVAFRIERVTAGGVTGLAISFAGVLFLVLNTVSIRSGAAHTSIGGIVLMLVNTLCFASYIVLFKRTIEKYSVVTFMKWMFLFSTLYALPFGLKGLFEVDCAALAPGIIWQILFVVVCATFISYFLIPIGQKRLNPVLLCMYTYVQPIVAMAISLAAGMDTMTWGKAIATALVFAGVSMVNFAGKSRH
ncbi:MAG: EamA family transporter [Bacteroidales bacterium]|nr:EamA family transporter [Candidatus Cryptobacteroides choladohippi]